MRWYAGRGRQIGPQEGTGRLVRGDIGIQARQGLAAYVDDPFDGAVIGAQNDRVAILEIAVDGSNGDTSLAGDAGCRSRLRALFADNPLGYVEQAVALPHRPFLTRQNRMPGCPQCGHVSQR